MTDETLFAWGDRVNATKSADGLTGTVEALGVRYGDNKSVDFYGDYFTPKTDFGTHAGNGAVATLNHRIPLYAADTSDEEARVLERLARLKFANAIETERTDAGILARHILNLSDEYEKVVFEMAEAGHLRWSSGTAAHMVERDVDGEIKQWPIVEFAYTPQPAEPRLPRIQPVKALEGIKVTLSTGAQPVDIQDDDADAVEATGPKAGSKPAAVAAEDAVKSTEQTFDTPMEGEIMSEEKQEKQEEAVDNSAAMLDALTAVTEQLKGLSQRIEEIEEAPVKTVPVSKAPAVVRNLGDDATKAIAAFLRDGDMGGVQHLRTGQAEIDLAKLHDPGEATRLNWKASNATDMNIGTDADGGYAVPTGHYQNIIARRDQLALYPRVGVMAIPGVGTTVNVPIDNEADGEFVSTAEANQFDLDAPALDQVAMTLVKYTKRILLSDEVLEDEDSNLLSFVENWVGRGWAKTHNSLMITEALADGTAALTLDAAAAIGAAEIPELKHKLQPEYKHNAVWVVDGGTVGYLEGLTGDNFQFAPTPYMMQSGANYTLNALPLFETSYMPDIGGGNKSLLLGDFSFMGMRMPTELKLIVDPYTRADYGQVRRLYSFRCVYEVLQAEAFAYATHPTA